MAKQLETAKQMFPRLPWADGAIVTATPDGRTHVLVGRHRVTFAGEVFESKTYRPTSGTSRKARKGF
jgi:hypothetical protein